VVKRWLGRFDGAASALGLLCDPVLEFRLILRGDGPPLFGSLLPARRREERKNGFVGGVTRGGGRGASRLPALPLAIVFPAWLIDSSGPHRLWF